MKKQKILSNQSGIAHLGLILLVIVVVGAVSFGAYRVYDANRGGEEISEITDEDIQDSLDEQEGEAQADNNNDEVDVSTAESEAKNEVN